MFNVSTVKKIFFYFWCVANFDNKFFCIQKILLFLTFNEIHFNWWWLVSNNYSLFNDIFCAFYTSVTQKVWIDWWILLMSDKASFNLCLRPPFSNSSTLMCCSIWPLPQCTKIATVSTWLLFGGYIWPNNITVNARETSANK